MSANYGNADSGYPTGTYNRSGERSNPVSSRGMELSRSIYPSQPPVTQSRQDSLSMSTLTMRAPTMLPSPRDMQSMAWSDRRPLERPARTRSPQEREELPSIRQVIPDFHQTRPGRTDSEYITDSYSPTSAQSARETPSDFLPSPSMNKRRRLSTDDEFESTRERSIPRMYKSPPRLVARPLNGPLSPISAARSAPGFPPDSQSHSNRGSPYAPPRSHLQTVDGPNTQSTAWRTLPRLPALAVGLDVISPRSRTNFSEYSIDSPRSGAQTYPQLTTSAFNPPTQMSSHPYPSFSYGYQQPRGQSYSGPPSTYSNDRSPFTSNHHSPYPSNGYVYGNGIDDPLNDNKQRKRRGNLPKETTDKLRAWFIAHLQHPYPTEDEKQELMRQTNLQMNQISNWFINARRRQLPAMINSARAEHDARSARAGDGHIPGESASDFGDDREKTSDGETSGYDDDFDLRSRRVLEPRKRDSI